MSLYKSVVDNLLYTNIAKCRYSIPLSHLQVGHKRQLSHPSLCVTLHKYEKACQPSQNRIQEGNDSQRSALADGDTQAYVAVSRGNTLMNRLPTDTEEKYFLSQEQHGRRLLLKRRTWHSFWQIGIFRLIIATGICFLLLIGLAMLVYPGRTMADPYQHAMRFSRIF